MRNLNLEEGCPSIDLIYRYLEKRLTKKEAGAVEHHLNSCETCFHEMASLVRNSFSPATESEKREIAKMRTLTPEQQVSKILSYHKQLNPVVSEKIDRAKLIGIDKINDLIRKIKEYFNQRNYILQPVVVTLFIVALIFTGYKGVHYYNTGHQIKQAQHLLQDNYRTYIENTQLSGNYGPSGIGILLAGDEDKPSYLEQAESRLLKAIDKGSKSPKAKHLLAQVFIIDKNYTKADSLLTQIKQQFSDSASILNDIGVLYFQQKDWENAAMSFHSALEEDENFLKAYFNLGLTKIQLQQPHEAIPALKRYLELEDNEAWRRAAKRLLNEIK